ncbi:MAG: hypothetical protein BWY80_00408 [Firmicutes bacterium ADurb.Bin456]|nr:MAG: hypothetical protein BWY80_00408 [Firmicutes bacterium ADurb.Bin456]
MEHLAGQVHDLPQDSVNPVTDPDPVFEGFYMDVAGILVESPEHNRINQPDNRGLVNDNLFFIVFFGLLLNSQFPHGLFHFGDAEMLVDQGVDFLFTGCQGHDVKSGNQP